MSDSKHTPGPWRTSGPDGMDIEAEGGSTFWAFVSMDTPEAERKPNARLIAAAPDLLEALECLLKADHEDVRSMAINAIDKARGRQP